MTLPSLPQPLRSPLAVALLAGLLTFAAVLGIRTTGGLQAPELAVYDHLLAQRPEPEAPGRRVVVIGYSELDLREQGFPLPDGTLARVLDTALAEGARAVGVDFHREIPIPPGTEALEAVVARDPRVIMIFRYGVGNDPFIPPPRGLEGTEQVGYSDLNLDDDDVVRRAILYQDDEVGGTGLSLALRLALLYLAPEGAGLSLDPEEPEQLLLGPTPLPRFTGNEGAYVRADAEGYQLLLDYEGSRPFRSLTVGELLRGEYEADALRDKIVLVGATAGTHSDLINVPFGQWPGVFVHGHIASQLVRYGLGEDRPLGALSDRAEAAWVLVWALLGAGLGLWRRSVWLFGAIVLSGVACVLEVAHGGLRLGWWVPPVAPGLAWLAAASGISAYLSRREHAERQALMNLFSRHMSNDVARDLWQNREEFLDGGRPRPRRLVATSIFIDVKGFTGAAEKLEPLSLMEWLNDFMDRMASIAGEHGGIVDDYFGDGMKADFGVPVPRETEEETDADAVAAVRSALAMERALVELNVDWRRRGLPEGAMRIGIATGTSVAGSLGSSDRLKYTLVGDTVNIAARLEHFDDSGHDFSRKLCRILISESTCARLGERFETSEFGKVALKGKESKVQVWEVLGPARDAAPGRDSHAL